MAYGTTNVDNIQSSTAGTPVVFKDGSGTQIGTLCRAWCKFNSSTGAITSLTSFNVSSVTYNGAGNYTVNFTTALADANASVVTNGLFVTSSFSTNYAYAVSSTSTSIYHVENNTLVNTTYMSVAIFR
jgi:hypothetical protein